MVKKKEKITLKLETLCLLSHVWLSAIPWTAACQVPLSIGFSRQEYWSGLPISSPGDLPNPRIKPESLESPALTGGFFIMGPCRKTPISLDITQKLIQEIHTLIYECRCKSKTKKKTQMKTVIFSWLWAETVSFSPLTLYYEKFEEPLL